MSQTVKILRNSAVIETSDAGTEVNVLRNTVTVTIPSCTTASLSALPATAYDNDTAAKAAGLVTGAYYVLSDSNTYGVPGGIVKKITE